MIKCEHNLGDYYIFKSAFTQDEINGIKKICDQYKLHAAGIMSSSMDVSLVRRSKIAWIEKNDSTLWVYNRLISMIIEANSIWNFKINENDFVIQYTEYCATKRGFYGCHYDISSHAPGVFRKISVVVQLSHQEDYSGGEFVLSTPNNMALEVSREIGDVILFPSYMPHEVKPVICGKRLSLVMWIPGPPFT